MWSSSKKKQTEWDKVDGEFCVSFFCTNHLKYHWRIRKKFDHKTCLEIKETKRLKTKNWLQFHLLKVMFLILIKKRKLNLEKTFLNYTMYSLIFLKNIRV